VDYYKQLHLKVTDAGLKKGLFKHRRKHGPGLAPVTSNAAGHRAGVDSGPIGLAPLIVVGVLALVLAAIAARRRPLQLNP
jgi:hypothetical protein